MFDERTDPLLDLEQQVRRAELADQDRAAAEAAERAKKNKGFVQVYPKGWSRLQGLIVENPTAARIYAFLASKIDGTTGAVVAAQSVLAEALSVSEITIRRQTKWLEDAKALVRIRVGAGVYAYALDPEEVWRSYDNAKDDAVFNAKTLVSKKDRENATVQRKLMVMIREQRGEPELPLGGA